MTHTCCPHCSTVGHFPHSGGCPKECCEECNSWPVVDICTDCPCHKDIPAAFIEKVLNKNREVIERTPLEDKPEKEWWEESFKELIKYTDKGRDYYYGFMSDPKMVEIDIKDFISRIAAQSEKKGAESARQKMNAQMPQIMAESEKKGREEVADYIFDCIGKGLSEKVRSSEEGKTNNK